MRLPEIHLDEEFGYNIYQTILRYELTNNLEIGSWDGAGSTKCFVDAMKNLGGKKRLLCVERCKEKIDVLDSLYKDLDFVVPVCGSSIACDEMLHKNFDDIWDSPFNKIPKNIYAKETVKSWFDHDMEFLKTIKTGAITKYGSEEWDSVLIDGGEFIGYSEFSLLKDKAKIFFLDDVHNAFKCYQIYDELKNHPDWELLSENPDIRNGFAIFKLRSF